METKDGSKGNDSKGQGNIGSNGNRHSSGGNRSGSSGNSGKLGGKSFNKGHNNQGKTGKPCREIYRPPSLRSKTSRGSSIGVNEPSPETIEICNTEPTRSKIVNEGVNINSKASGSNLNPRSNGNTYTPNGGGSVPSSPLITRHVFNFNEPNPNQQTVRSLNVNAKEFQFSPIQHQMQNQQLANLLSQLDPCFYGEAAGALIASSGMYGLQQSKSLENNMNVFLRQQLQAANSRQMGYNNPNTMGLQYNMSNAGVLGLGFTGGQNLQHQPQHQKSVFVDQQGQDLQGQFNRLAQSKSSGSIPGIGGASSSKPRVRFDDEDSDEEANRNMMKNAESIFASMKLHSEAFMENRKQDSKSPAAVPKLQKSRTGFYLNMYTPSLPAQTLNPSYPQQAQGILKPTQVQSNQQMPNQIQQPTSVKRSRSFGSGSINQTQRTASHVPIYSVYSDFQISRWPKRIQESVTAAVTAVERVAARTQIEMVNSIFEAMLTSFDSSKIEGNNKGTEEISWRNHETGEDSSDLSSPAVHIFLYFIQREKERTIMESLLNTCFATFQKLFGSSQPNRSSEIIARQCSIFLKFLSTLYTQVKLIQRKNSKQQGQTMDEMSFTLLALVCDSCLATLRSRLCNEPSLMGCLFTVMTSQGRDMEGTFPLKMKQLLAAVRDALLGLGPYSKGPMSTVVQKTLMQLIELHAANWALPASAVRYYYTNNSNSPGSKVPPGSSTSNMNS